MKVLILCTGNSCRSQMAEGFLKSFDSQMEVYSAGTEPSSQIHPIAVQVMANKEIDISQNVPKSVNEFTDQNFDYVITVCDDAKETCPNFTGEVKNRIHIAFDDPTNAKGTEVFILSEYKRIRDEIKHDFTKFYKGNLKESPKNLVN